MEPYQGKIKLVFLFLGYPLVHLLSVRASQLNQPNRIVVLRNEADEL